jgi:hypothetical protein
MGWLRRPWPATLCRGLIISISRAQRPHASCSADGFDEAEGQAREDGMSSTLTSTCGLGYPNRALLELHIREDHPRHRQAAGEPQHDAGSRTANKVTTRTAAPQPRRPRSPSVLEAARRGIHTLGKLSWQMAYRMEAMVSQDRPRHPLAARKRAKNARAGPDAVTPLPRSGRVTKPFR